MTAVDPTFDRLSRLSAISLAMSRPGADVTALLELILGSAVAALRADEGYLCLTDPESFELRLAVAQGKRRSRPRQIPCPERRTALTSAGEFGFAPLTQANGSEASEAAMSPEARLLRQVFLDRERRLFVSALHDPSFVGVPYLAAVIVPLKTENQCLGVMVLANTQRQATFTGNDLEEATVFANLAAVAVEHRKLVDERETRLNEMGRLHELAKRFSAVQTLEGLIGLSFEYLGRIVPADLGVVTHFNNDEETRYFVSNRPLAPRSLEGLTTHIDDVTRTLRERPPRLVRSQQIFLPAKEGGLVQPPFRRSLRSFMTVPLVVQGQNIGLINLSSTRENAFSRDHLRGLTTLATILATAIENIKIRLFLERRLDELSVLFEISQSLTSTLVLDEVLSSIVNFSMDMMHALRCELRLIDAKGEYLEIRASRGLSRTFLNSTPVKVGEGLLGEAVHTRKAISVVDLRKDPRTRHIKLVRRERLAGLLAVPICQRSQAIGVISVYTSKPRDFTQKEIDLLSTFASQASIAIENARLYARMKEQYLAIVTALAAAIETKDAYTHGHSKNVMEMAVKIARELHLNEGEIETIKYAGLLHDIGKIGINDRILSKDGELTVEERDLIREHPRHGAFIIERVDFLRDIAPLTLYHHERFDGTGYPLGLAGEKIPLGARILAVADTYDSMIADRPYRKALPYAKVVEEMRKASGTQLDPALVQVLLEILRRERRAGAPA